MATTSTTRAGARAQQDRVITACHPDGCAAKALRWCVPMVGLLVLVITSGCHKSDAVQLAEKLRSGKNDARHEAAKSLEALGPAGADAVTQLAASLADPTPTVRYHAAKALSKMGAAAAPSAGAIAKSLSSADPQTQYFLLKTL